VYPGALKPEVALYWISRVCKGIREHLEVVPPIFDHCTSEISYETELDARDLYWQFLTDGASLAPSLRTDLLQGVIRRSPFIAEPRVYLAEVLFRGGDFDGCAEQLRQALRLFYAMGTNWDKRVPYRQWISHSRLLLARCVRRSEGKSSMPITKQGVVLTEELVVEMERVSPIAQENASATAPWDTIGDGSGKPSVWVPGTRVGAGLPRTTGEEVGA